MFSGCRHPRSGPTVSRRWCRHRRDHPNPGCSLLAGSRCVLLGELGRLQRISTHWPSNPARAGEPHPPGGAGFHLQSAEVGNWENPGGGRGRGCVWGGEWKSLALRQRHHAARPGAGTWSARSAGARPAAQVPAPARAPPPDKRPRPQGPHPQPPRDPKAPGSGEPAGRRSTPRRSYWLEVTPIWVPRPDNWPAGAEFAEPQ